MPGGLVGCLDSTPLLHRRRASTSCIRPDLSSWHPSSLPPAALISTIGTSHSACWHAAHAQQPRLSTRIYAAHQQSHMEEAISDMQSFQHRPGHSHHHHSHKKHVFRRTTTTATLPPPKTEKLPQAVIPHLDGHTDPTDVLSWLREHLLMTRARASAVITAEETGAALLDLVSVLILLDEDVRNEEQGSAVVFQPVLDLKNKTNLRPPRPLNGNGNGHHEPQPLVAALISKARCPKLLLEQPSTCIAATLHMDSADVASIIAEAVEEHGSTRLRVANSAAGLVAAWRAVRRARAVVRARSEGARDILCTAQVESLTTSMEEGEEEEACGGQRGIMYVNIWRMR